MGSSVKLSPPFFFVGFALTGILFTFFGLWLATHSSQPTTAYPNGIGAAFSPKTIKAIQEDKAFHNVLLSFAEVIADSSTGLGDKYRIEGLKHFGVNITDGITQLRQAQQSELRRRGFFDDIGQKFGDLFKGGAGGSGGVGGLNFTGGFNGFLENLGSTVVGSLSTPSLFLGVGLGMGASTGLNLTSIQEANNQAAKIAAAYNSTASGFNLVAQNLGSGLAGQIAPALGNNNISIAPAAFALAQGIGNATAKGLNLTNKEFAPSQDGSLEAIAGNLGFGIAMPIIPNIDVKGVMSGFGGSNSKLLQQLPEIAAAAGTGLGEGAKTGLGFGSNGPSAARVKRQQANDPFAGVNVPDTVGSFTKGLSQAFFSGVDLKNLNLTGGANLPSMKDIQAMIRPLAAGAGAGIGMGAAIGLNFKKADAVPAFGSNITADDQHTAMIAEGFVQNLVSNFLNNSTVLDKAGQMLSENQPSLLKDVKAAKAAEGFARGTVEGVLSAMSSVGGIKNLIDGNMPADAIGNVPILEPTTFDDTLNGSAVSFARGLMGEGTILVAEIIRNLTKYSNSPSTTPARHKRSLFVGGGKKNAASPHSISIRQAENSNPQVPLAIDSQSVEMVAQKGVDLLTCQGVGGLASVGSALLSGGNPTKLLSPGNGAGLDSAVLQTLPDGPVTVESEGNTFTIVLKESKVEINGKGIKEFITLTALHIVFSGLAFLFLLPLYVILGVVWRLSVLIGFPINEQKNNKWRLGMLITFALLALVGIALGMAGMGNSGHFRDAHGILGLFTFLSMFPTVVVGVMRLRTTLPHPPAAASATIKSQIAILKSPERIYAINGILTQASVAFGQIAFLHGFSILRAISLCLVDALLSSFAVAMVVNIALMIQVISIGLVMMRMWLEQHVGKREAAGAKRFLAQEASFPFRRRLDSDMTFGFDKEPPPPPAKRGNFSRPALPQRKTKELIGHEDSAIGKPYNFRRE